ncbi:hypothetical protein ACHAQH_006113 [Verticillium albo-atrum]
MAYLGRQYAEDPPIESAWWAALNIVLATAQRRRAGRDPSNWQETLSQAWKYVSNAMEAVLDILFHNISLLSVQALVGIGRFFLDTPNPQPTFILSSSAVRLGQAIGLHKQDCQSTHVRADKKQRARVFWCAKILDQQACFKTGRPPAQKTDDFAVNLPGVGEGDGLGTCVSLDGAVILENFRLDAHLSVIEADTFQRLYSAATPASNSSETQATVEDLDQQLELWVQSIPTAARHGNIDETNWGESTRPYLYRLHLRYYACLVSIHRAQDLQGFWTLRKQSDTRKLSRHLGPSIQKCVGAARAMVSLLWKVPRNRCSFYWDLLAFATSALFIIYIYTKRVPCGERPWQDLEDMRSTVRFMRTQIDHGADSFIHDLQVAAEAACESSEAAVTKANVPSPGDALPRDCPPLNDHSNQRAFMNEYQDMSTGTDASAPFEVLQPLEGLDLVHQQILEFPWSFLDSDLGFNDDSSFTGFGI